MNRRLESSRITSYVKSHLDSLGVVLAAYGAFYLATTILGYWTLADWGKDVVVYPPQTITPLLPRSFINPLFFVTSLPALIIGAAMLCIYSLQTIDPLTADNKEHVAILLTVSGFTYLVIGAWPLMNAVDLAWDFQKQIMKDGAVFAWTLYLLALAAFVVGAVSVYRHSKIWHLKHHSEADV